MSIKTRLAALEKVDSPDLMEITILRFNLDEPLPAAAIIGNTKISYQYADVDE